MAGQPKSDAAPNCTRIRPTLAVLNAAPQSTLYSLERTNAGLTLTALVAVLLTFGGDIEDALFGDGLSSGAVRASDAASAALWSASLWFVSPLQLLLLFLGRIETERPSDWLMNVLGRALGQSVTDLGYKHSVMVYAIAMATTVCAGSCVAFALVEGLGDATWGVSSGIAACMAAGVYELGRPTRLSSEEAIQQEGQWQQFGATLLQNCPCFEFIWRAHVSISLNMASSCCASCPTG
jgi:hypothetical protein